MNTLIELLGTNIAYAQSGQPSAVAVFVGKVNRYLLNPMIILLFAAALVYFLFGMVQFMANQDKSDKRDDGKRHMLWGIVGMFIMFGVFAILRVIASTLGVPSTNIPSS